MNELIYRVCADVLGLGVGLTASAHLPPSAEMRQRMVTALDKLVGEGRRAGLADADLAEARYALVAFLDEQVLKSNWSGRADWMNRPLQLELYRENMAGENFFARLRALLRDGKRPAALEAYYLCLNLGFQGAYGQSGDLSGLEGFSQAVRQQLSSVLPSPDKISPHAKPKAEGVAAASAQKPLLAVILGAVLLILILVLLAWSVNRQLKAAVAEMAPPKTQVVERPVSP